jgi:hypothetical protein
MKAHLVCLLEWQEWNDYLHPATIAKWRGKVCLGPFLSVYVSVDLYRFVTMIRRYLDISVNLLKKVMVIEIVVVEERRRTSQRIII